MKIEKIVVVGVGGVGGTFGGKLAKKGLNVTFLATPNTSRVMKQEGLRVESPEGDYVIKPVNVADNSKEVGIADVIIICTKTFHLHQIRDSIEPMVGDNTFIVPLENGLDAPEIFASRYGKNKVMGGLCKVISYKIGPGHIKHAAFPPTAEFGEIDGSLSDRANALKEIFESAGIRTVVHENIIKAMWIKMLLIAPMAGIGAVTRVPLGKYRSVPESRALLRRLMEEIRMVGVHEGVDLPEELIEQIMKGIDSLPETTIASMQRDFLNGNPSELEALIGTFVKRTNSLSMEIPITRFIYSSLLPMQLEAVRSNQ